MKRIDIKNLVKELEPQATKKIDFVETVYNGEQIVALFTEKAKDIIVFTKNDYALLCSYSVNTVRAGSSFHKYFYCFPACKTTFLATERIANLIGLPNLVVNAKDPTITLKVLCDQIDSLYQELYEKKRLIAKQKRDKILLEKVNHINSVVSNRVPLRTMEKYFFKHNSGINYVFSNDGLNGVCVRCGNTFKFANKMKHKSNTKCPVCHRLVNVARTGYMTYYNYSIPVCFPDFSKSEVFRYWFYNEHVSFDKNTLELKIETSFSREVARIEFVNGKPFYYEFEDNMFKPSAKYFFREFGISYSYNHAYVGNSLFYTNHLNAESKIKAFADSVSYFSENNQYTDYYGYLYERFYTECDKPYFEKLNKVNLGFFVYCSTGSYPRSPLILPSNESKNSVIDVLGVNKVMYRWLLQNRNIGYIDKRLKLLQEIHSKGLPFNADTFSLISETIGNDVIGLEDYEFLIASNTVKKCRYIMQNNLSVHTYQQLLINLVKLEYIFEERLSELKDISVKDILYMGSKYNKSTLYPVNFEKTLKELEDRVRLSRTRVYEDKIKNVADKILNNEQLKAFVEKSPFIVDVPSSSKEFFEIGQKMQNCLGKYGDKVANKECVIFLVKKASNPNELYYAVEVTEDMIAQVRTFANANGSDYEKVYHFSKGVYDLIKSDCFADCVA